MNTVMVVGGTGFLGSNLINHLRKKFKVIAFFRKQIIRYEGTTHFVYSFDDRDFVKRVISIMKPSAMIYCSGINDMLECHKRPNVADAVHSLGPVFFGTACETLPHRIIYLSSSYVYDGKKGSYTESDLVMPETTLGKSKLAGENYIRAKLPIYTIFRLAPVIGIGTPYHPTAIDRLRQALSLGHRHELPENENHSFVSLNVVLDAVEWVLSNETTNELYNLGGLTKLSTYDLGVEIAKKLKLDPALITPGRGIFKDSSFLDFSLNATKFVKSSKINSLVLEESLDLLKKQLIR